MGRRCLWCYCLSLLTFSSVKIESKDSAVTLKTVMYNYPSFISAIEISGDLGVEGTNASRCT